MISASFGYLRIFIYIFADLTFHVRTIEPPSRSFSSEAQNPMNRMKWLEVANVNCRARMEIISAIWNRKIIVVIDDASMLSIGNVKICK